MKPLVIRANVGEKVVISFSHSLNRALSIHVLGMAYDVQTSDGANVGFNQDTTTGTGSPTPGMLPGKVSICSMIWVI